MDRLFYDIIPPQKIKKFAKEEIFGIKVYKSKTGQYFAMGWRLVFLSLFVFYFISGITPFNFIEKARLAFSQEEGNAVYYTQLCEDETQINNPGFQEYVWQNAKNAQGSPEVCESCDINYFSRENSAIYRGGLANLICRNFQANDIDIQTKSDTLNTSATSVLPAEIFATGTENEISDPENAEANDPTSFLEKLRNFLGFSVKAQENNFSAKIKLSWAVMRDDIPPAEGIIPTNATATTSINSAGQEQENSGGQATSSQSEIIFWNKIKNFFTAQNVKAEESGGTIADNGNEDTIAETATGTAITGGIISEDANTDASSSIPIVAQEINTTTIIIQETDTVASPVSATSVSAEENKKETSANPVGNVIIWYSLDGELWTQLDIIKEYNLSNASDGGYFEYDAPFLRNEEDIKNLQIKLEGRDDANNITVYLDSVWIEVNPPERISVPELIKKILVLNFEKQKETTRIYKQEGYYLNDENVDAGEDSVINELNIFWYAEWDYRGFKSRVFEEDLDWSWQEFENTLVGETVIDSCPVELRYHLDDNNQLEINVYFINKKEYPVENLNYKFTIKYSSDFTLDNLDNAEFNLRSDDEEIKIQLDKNMLENSVNKNFSAQDGQEQADFLMQAGTVAPGGHSQVTLKLF